MFNLIRSSEEVRQLTIETTKLMIDGEGGETEIYTFFYFEQYEEQIKRALVLKQINMIMQCSYLVVKNGKTVKNRLGL